MLAGPRARADRRRRLRRAAVGRARGGSPPGDRAALDPARAAPRRDRDRDALEAPPLSARAAEPDDRRDGRAWAGAPALARRVPDRRGRNRDRPPPALASLRARDAGSVPRVLPRAARRPRGERSSPPASWRRPRTSALSPRTAPAAPVTRSCPTSTGTAAGRHSTGSARSSSRAAATTRRHERSASCRHTESPVRSRWRTAARVAKPGSASC